ncbi:MAG: hypothetical protein HWQ23_04240 [Nostoc sp. JL33]|nr:hypothetical protein [Nostoc sp. JL33]
MPEIFLEEIERYARSLDKGLSPSPDSSSTTNDLGSVLSAVKSWKLGIRVLTQLKI